jgi:adenylyltransferase/sulfurtransferase
MAKITFTIPSVLNQGGGEKKTELESNSLQGAFEAISEILGDDFKRRVLEFDGTPRSLINIYINGKNAKFSNGMKTELHDGDDVYILPAVAGGSKELSKKELDKFSRQVMLEEIGYNGQLKLKNARICVIGVGGLGNPITSRLAAMGVGTLRIVDRDVIELSNLHRQTMFSESNVGQVKVEVAAKKLSEKNPDCIIEPLAVSVNEYTALEVIKDCDVVIDALDSVDARYALNKACVKLNIPFVTGAAVGVTGQAFTILPKESACYYCMFPDLDEDSMPTCSLEGVHPSILSIMGGIEVAEAIKVIMGKKPSLSDKILHVDIETMDFTSTQTFRVEECPICGTGKLEESIKEELILEELCGRNHGKRTFSITPTNIFDLNVDSVIAIAKSKGLLVDNQGDLGLSLRNNNLSVSFMKKGSAVIVGPKDEESAISLYKELLA